MEKRIKLNIQSLTEQVIEQIKRYLTEYPNYDIILNFKNTNSINLYNIRQLESISNNYRIKIRIEGAYTDKRINDYTAPNYVDMHKNDNIYSIYETKCILREIENIESGININWSQEQKLMYFIGYLKNKIIYHPFYETAPSKEIRSLRGLLSHKTVCAGYALILKELCDRNGIMCEYVEGCTTKEKAEQEVLTHAWNIVYIGGNYIPIDLTWNASKSKSGKIQSIEDIANVNEFIKSHFPGKHERIQDYQHTLKSIDGKYLRSLNNLINKDMTYDSATMRGTRKNGEVFYITQVSEKIIENEYVYGFIYNKINQDGSLSPPLLLYSKTNVAAIVSNFARREKLIKQLNAAYRSNNYTKAKEIEDRLKGSEFLPQANDAVDNLLFSTENIIASTIRKDNYLGGIQLSKEQPRYVTGVEIDPSMAKKINSKSRTFTRKDGTSFVLESFDTISLGPSYKIYRYKLYEYININGKNILKKNTIFTDEDIMYDYRSGIANDFLDRHRIDRKLKETGGYLGYYSKDGVRTYNPQINEIFKRKIYEQYRIKKSHIKDYCQELTFEDMKRIVKTYTMAKGPNGLYVINRQSGRQITDSMLINQVKFSILWLNSAGMKWMANDVVEGYTYAFEVEEAEKIFSLISNSITSSINKFGFIDPVDILNNVIEQCGEYKYARTIVTKLFATQQNLDIINNLYHQQNPSSFTTNAKKEQPLINENHALHLIEEEKRRLEESKKQILEVISKDGKVVVEPKRQR